MRTALLFASIFTKTTRSAAIAPLIAAILSIATTSSASAANSAASAQDIANLWQLVQRQQQQIDALQTQVATLTESLQATTAQATSTTQRLAVAEENLANTADYVEEISVDKQEQKTWIGGYGELHYNRLDAQDSERDLREADFHRFVVTLNHAFSDRLKLFTEVELEHGLVKDTADGSNGGEVELEQAFIDYSLNDQHYLRGGLFLLPIGLINETHEPPTFFGVERNSVENVLIPTTWWEAGFGAGGRYSNGLSWDAAVHTGLAIPSEGSSSLRVRSGRQKVSNASADDLAFTLRLKYTGIPGLEVATSFQHQSDASQYKGDGIGHANLISAHLDWRHNQWGLRALWADWNFSGRLPQLLDADDQRGWYVEPSYRLDPWSWGQLGWYGRFQDVRGARQQDRFDQWELGVNLWLHNNVVLKFDYRDRSHDLQSAKGRNFHGIDLGVGYQF